MLLTQMVRTGRVYYFYIEYFCVDGLTLVYIEMLIITRDIVVIG